MCADLPLMGRRVRRADVRDDSEFIRPAAEGRLLVSRAPWSANVRNRSMHLLSGPGLASGNNVDASWAITAMSSGENCHATRKLATIRNYRGQRTRVRRC